MAARAVIVRVTRVTQEGEAPEPWNVRNPNVRRRGAWGEASADRIRWQSQSLTRWGTRPSKGGCLSAGTEQWGINPHFALPDPFRGFLSQFLKYPRHSWALIYLRWWNRARVFLCRDMRLPLTSWQLWLLGRCSYHLPPHLQLRKTQSQPPSSWHIQTRRIFDGTIDF
jgi:hypothetical protein